MDAMNQLSRGAAWAGAAPQSAAPRLSVPENGFHDGITALKPIRDRFPRFADLLASEREDDLFERLRAAESVGRPLGDERFLTRLERSTGRVLKAGKRGPKPSEPERD
jgi:putative transposase